MSNTALAVSNGLSPTGWSPTGELTFDQWSEIGVFLLDLRDASQWALGDWLNFGEAKWGEKYAQALNEKRASYQTLRNVSSVCRAYAPSERVADVSFSHHALVSGWETDTRADALIMFAEKDFNRDEARAWKEEQQGDVDRVLSRAVGRALAATRRAIDLSIDGEVRQGLLVAHACLEDVSVELEREPV